MEIYYDIRFCNEGKMFDENCFRILCAVEKTGSLNQAAKEVCLTYCVALKIMKRNEQELGFALLERKKGGSEGGGSQLTPEAKKFMEQYRSFNKELAEAVRTIRDEHFGPKNTVP